MLTVVLGGARSGKSRFAEQLAQHAGTPVTVIATAAHIPGDHDLADRIARHRADRPPAWHTIEAPTELAAAIDEAGEALVIVDCLTVWVNNLLHHGHDEADVLGASEAALERVRTRTLPTVAISNEVGLGIVPVNELARRYRDLLGRVNQRWAAVADRALLMVAGRAVALGDPHELW